jgi:hypothetical protein
VGGGAAYTEAAVPADRPPTPDPSPPRAKGAWREGSAVCMTSRSRRMFCARYSFISHPLQAEGAGNAGRSMRPQAACAMVVVERTRVSQVTPEKPGIPHAMVYGLYRALPGEPAFLPPSPVEIAFHQLDTSVGVSGPHDFTVRFRAVHHRHYQRPPHPAPRFVTLRNAPLWDGTAGNIEVIWVFGKAEYFCGEALTQGSKNNPTSKSVGRFNPTPASS